MIKRTSELAFLLRTLKSQRDLIVRVPANKAVLLVYLASIERLAKYIGVNGK